MKTCRFECFFSNYAVKQSFFLSERKCLHVLCFIAVFIVYDAISAWSHFAYLYLCLLNWCIPDQKKNVWNTESIKDISFRSANCSISWHVGALLLLFFSDSSCMELPIWKPIKLQHQSDMTFILQTLICTNEALLMYLKIKNKKMKIVHSSRKYLFF